MNAIKFRLEDYIQKIENQPKGYSRFSLPSVSDNLRKAYYKRVKLSLQERWNMFWSDQCYPLRHI